MSHNRKSLTRDQIEAHPVRDDVDWYQYTLECGHKVYCKARISVPRDYSFVENFVRCPQCRNAPTNWAAITDMRIAPNAEVSNVLSGTSFIVPRSIMRTISSGSPNPYPYTTNARDYD